MTRLLPTSTPTAFRLTSVGDSKQTYCSMPELPHPAHIAPPCFLQGFDYYQPGCGYAPMLAIYDNRSDADAQGWFSGMRGYDASLAEPGQCQLICQDKVPGCAFWSFEVQPDVPEARCYLKSAYDDSATCGYSVWDGCGGGYGTCWSGPARCGLSPPLPPARPTPPLPPPDDSVATLLRSVVQLRAAVSSAVPGSTLSFVVEPGSTLRLGGQHLVLSNNINLNLSTASWRQDGMPGVLDAERLSRHFMIYPGSALSLMGLHLVNGTSPMDGGSICVLGKLNAIDLNISQSTCAPSLLESSTTPAMGGSVFVSRNASADLTRCNIWDSTAANTNTNGQVRIARAFGGAIFVYGWTQNGGLGPNGERPGQLILLTPMPPTSGTQPPNQTAQLTVI